MKLPASLPQLPPWAWAALGLGAAWGLLRPKDAAKSIGKGMANTATGVFKGLSEGLLGVPDTDEAKCHAALAENDGQAASLYCPAWKLFAAIPGSFSQWWNGLTVKPVRPSAHGAFSGPAVSQSAGVLTPSIINGGSFETGQNCILLGVDCSATGEKQFDLGEWIEEKTPTITVVGGIRG